MQEPKIIELKKKTLTIDELRSSKGLENLTDEQATEAIWALEELALLIIELYEKNEKEKFFDINIEETYEEQRKAA